jgi:hypothetical protein
LRSALAWLGLLWLARAPAAWGQALKATEYELGPVATLARQDFAGISLGLSRRPSTQGRAAVRVAGGVLSGDAALRVDVTGEFLVLPDARRGVSPYLGLGVSYLGAAHRRGSGALVALLGLEAPEGQIGGWFGELGLGGGLLIRAGYRWRRFPPF